MSLKVIYEDNHLLVIDKPAGIATMGTESHVDTVARQAAEYLRVKYNKPGNVFVGVVSRLDSLVSGVLVLARTSKAASRLSEQIRRQSTSKRYIAVVEGVWGNQLSNSDWLQLEDYVTKNEALHRMELVDAKHPRAQLAKLRFRVLNHDTRHTMVEIELQTGRKHQIRLQLAEQGYPVMGDRKYGANSSFGKGIALHCFENSVDHPTSKERLTFHSSPTAWASHLEPGFVRRGIAGLQSCEELEE